MANRDIYQEITDKVLAKLESLPESNWRMPWARLTASGTPRNAVTKKAYQGTNTFVLWFAADDAGYTSSEWATFKQWKSLGASVRKGEKATYGIYFSTFEKEDDNGDTRKIPFAKSFALFNANQVDNYDASAPVELTETERLAHADAFVTATGAEIHYGGDRACFIPSADRVLMPLADQFHSTSDFYGVLFHELTHWSGHKSRLDRNMTGRFGEESYAAEELVAELGAALLCGVMQIDAEPRDDHAHYIKSWIKVLKEDKRAFITAASQAQKAADYLLACDAAEVAA